MLFACTALMWEKGRMLVKDQHQQAKEVPGQRPGKVCLPGQKRKPGGGAETVLAWWLLPLTGTPSSGLSLTGTTSPHPHQATFPVSASAVPQLRSWDECTTFSARKADFSRGRVGPFRRWRWGHLQPFSLTHSPAQGDTRFRP